MRLERAPVKSPPSLTLIPARRGVGGSQQPPKSAVNACTTGAARPLPGCCPRMHRSTHPPPTFTFLPPKRSPCALPLCTTRPERAAPRPALQTHAPRPPDPYPSLPLPTHAHVRSRAAPAPPPLPPTGAMTDAGMLAYIQRRVRASAVFLTPYAKLQRRYLKTALQVRQPGRGGTGGAEREGGGDAGRGCVCVQRGARLPASRPSPHAHTHSQPPPPPPCRCPQLFGSADNAPRVQAVLLVRAMAMELPQPSLDNCLKVGGWVVIGRAPCTRAARVLWSPCARCAGL